MIIARLITIAGEVQGVGYRAFAQRSAAKHQVKGYVTNLVDGRVEAHVEGSPAAVEGFKMDLAAGPRYARVARLEELVIDPTGLYSNFRIER